MQISELIEHLYSASEEEVYIEIEGILYDIDFGHEEGKFDGFFTSYSDSLTLKPRKEEEDEDLIPTW